MLKTIVSIIILLLWNGNMASQTLVGMLIQMESFHG